MIHKTYKIKIEVSPEEARVLDEQSRIVNGVYNYCVAKSREWKAQYIEARQNGETAKAKAIGKKLYSKYGYRDLIPSLRLIRPWLAKVNSRPIRDAALRVAQAIKRHQSGAKNGQKGAKMAWPTQMVK